MRRARLTFVLLLLLTAGTLASPHALVAPGKPKNLKAVADGPHAVELDWRRVSGADVYYVYRDGSWIAEARHSDYRDEGLAAATTYVYRVSAVDGHGKEGDLSDAVQVTTDPQPGPSVPTDLVATAVGPYEIELSWSSSTGESGISAYRVFRDGAEVASTPDTTYSDSGLLPETTYEYRVSAVDGLGSESAPSEPASATTLMEPGPPPPVNLKALAAGPTRIDISWEPPAASTHPVEGYNVYREGAKIGFVISTAFADTELTPETEYGYAVSSVDDRGIEGDLSGTVRATTDAAVDVIPPAPPTGLRLVEN